MDPRVDPTPADGHCNLDIDRSGPELEGQIRDAINNDGTLIVEITAHFVVHHAARWPVNEDTLAELILSQGICPTNLASWKVIEANND